MVFERDGRVAGHAAAGEGGVTLLVDPGDEPGQALEALVTWLGEHGHREVDSYAADRRRIACLEERGYTHLRSSVDLQRGIDPPLAPAVWPSAVFGDGRGWVQQLAIARSARGLGIGRALLLHSLADLCSRGATSLALGVQGENESAIRLYRDIGFAVDREWRVYARPAVGRR